MSAPQPQSAELASELESSVRANYCLVAVSTLLIYDYLLTLCREIRLIWTCKAVGVRCMFFLNRFVTVALGATSISFTFSFGTASKCNIASWLNLCAVLMAVAVWAACSALRVHAVSDRNWRLSMLTLVLGLVPLGMELYFNIKTSYTILALQSTYCMPAINISATASILVLVGTHVCMIVSDAIVVAAIWYNTAYHWRHLNHDNVKSSLARRLQRDGTVYFCVLLVLNVLQMCLYLRDIATYFSTFIFPISTIIVSHLVLDLRDTRFSSCETTSSRTAQFEEYGPDRQQDLSQLSVMMFRVQSAEANIDRSVQNTSLVPSNDNNVEEDIEACAGIEELELD